MSLAERKFEELIIITKKEYSQTKRNSRRQIKIAASGLIFGMFLIHLLFASEHALVSVGGQQLVSKQQELKEIKLKNQQLNSEVKRLESLDRVAVIATTELDMSFPDDISKTPETSNIVESKENNTLKTSSKKDTSFLSSLKQILRRTFESLA